jgi:hypothetical protein
MFPSARSFLHDERGSLLVTEWVFLASILVIAILPAVAATRNKWIQTWQASSVLTQAQEDNKDKRTPP